VDARGARLRFCGFVLLLAIAARGGTAFAVDKADKQAVIEQVTALNRAAVAAYGDGDFKKMKSKLTEALAAGKDVLAGEAMLARTYLHLGVLYVDGLEDRPTALKYFREALKINPNIDVTAGMTTKTVTAAFEEAHHPPTAAEALAAEAGAGAADEAVAARKPTAKEARAAAAAEKSAAKALEAEKRRAAAEAQELERQVTQLRGDNERMKKELAELKDSDTKQRAENQRLQAELKKAVADAKNQLAAADAEHKKAAAQSDAEHKKVVAQSEAEQKKVLLQADTEQKRIQALADKEREAKEKLEKQLQERDKQLADATKGWTDAKARIQQLEKDKVDRDKTIADGLARETKEREAKEKLEKEKQAALAKEAERKAREEKERVDREKTAAGPDVPSHFAEKIYCDVPEVAPAGTDLYVHCLAQPSLKAKTLSFFYRTSGNSSYNAVVMEKSRKGWYTALVPAGQLGGKNLQYYTEARDGKESVAAASGKPASPNVLTLRGGRGK
jgi:hypothetical protein